MLRLKRTGSRPREAEARPGSAALAGASSLSAVDRLERFPGRLAQLGERRLDKAEVTGSSPVSPIEEVPGNRGALGPETVAVVPIWFRLWSRTRLGARANAALVVVSSDPRSLRDLRRGAPHPRIRRSRVMSPYALTAYTFRGVCQNTGGTSCPGSRTVRQPDLCLWLAAGAYDHQRDDRYHQVAADQDDEAGPVAEILS
jgi:hypothetical protein